MGDAYNLHSLLFQVPLLLNTFNLSALNNRYKFTTKTANFLKPTISLYMPRSMYLTLWSTFHMKLLQTYNFWQASP